METKRIVCLANSRMPGGRRVAGKELLRHGLLGRWIRPTIPEANQGLSAYVRQYEGGVEPQVLDVVDIPVIRAQPAGFQRENWLIDRRRRWSKAGRETCETLEKFTDPGRLWVDGNNSAAGVSNRLPVARTRTLNNSLRLIKVDSLRIRVHNLYGDRRIDGLFRHNRVDYRLRITDSAYESQYLNHDYGDYPIGECFLTISLASPHTDGFCYKLIAAVIKP